MNIKKKDHSIPNKNDIKYPKERLINLNPLIIKNLKIIKKTEK